MDARLAQLRRILGERGVVIWSTPSRWAAGEGLTLRFPSPEIDVACALAEGTLQVEGLSLVPPQDGDPQRDQRDQRDQREPGSVGAVISVPNVILSASPEATSTVC